MIKTTSKQNTIEIILECRNDKSHQVIRNYELEDFSEIRNFSRDD
jgi:hypothetical protein